VSVLSIEATRDKLGLEEPLTILVASDDPDRNEALIAELAEAFGEWPETVWVMTGYGLDALAERALYYVDADTLHEWNELAEEALDWEVCKASPLCVTIADPPELPDSHAVREAVDRSPAGSVLRQLTGQSAKQAGAGAEGDEGPQALCNDEGTVCAVQVMLSGSPGDLGYARMIKERAEAITVPLVQSQPEGTRIEVIGRYRVAPLEHGIILNDLRLVSILAAVGSLLVVLVFFRDLTAVVQLMVPMLSGLAVAVGLITLIRTRHPCGHGDRLRHSPFDALPVRARRGTGPSRSCKGERPRAVGVALGRRPDDRVRLRRSLDDRFPGFLPDGLDGFARHHRDVTVDARSVPEHGSLAPRQQ
jgi:hypothetical protein